MCDIVWYKALLSFGVPKKRKIQFFLFEYRQTSFGYETTSISKLNNKTCTKKIDKIAWVGNI